MGGLARKASIIDEAMADGDAVLLVDAGDLFFSKTSLVDGRDNVNGAKIRSEIIIDCYNEMGYNAFSPGSKDFALGLEYLKNLESRSDFNYISCNLFDSNTSQQIFNSYIIEDIKGFKIGYIGAASTFTRDSILVKEPVASIVETYNKISKKTDFTILLFNGTDSDIERLQKKEINIDLILRSKGSSRTSDNGGKGFIPVYTSGNKGKYLNKITVSMNKKDIDLIDINLENNNIRLSNKHLKNKQKGDPNANLDELYKDNPKILDDIAHHRDIVKTSIQKIDNAINTIESTKVPLNTKIDSKPEILLIVDKGMSRIPEGPPKDSTIKSIDRHKGHNH